MNKAGGAVFSKYKVRSEGEGRSDPRLASGRRDQGGKWGSGVGGMGQGGGRMRPGTGRRSIQGWESSVSFTVANVDSP